MNTGFKRDIRVAPLQLDSMSSLLHQRLQELDSLRPRRPPIAYSVFSLTAAQLKLSIRRRLAAAFSAIKLQALADIRTLPLWKIVTLTHCEKCGVSALTLLTRSTDRCISPGFAEKLRLLLPDESEILQEPVVKSPSRDERKSPVKRSARGRMTVACIRSGSEKLRHLLHTRLYRAFEALYLNERGKDVSLTFELAYDDANEKMYNISRIEQQAGTKVQEESFSSEDHILNTIESDSDPLLTASYSAATVLLCSRLEKLLSRRTLPLFSFLLPKY